MSNTITNSSGDEAALRIERLTLLNRVGVALSAEKNSDRLVEMILLEAKQLCNADGGTLYLRTDDDTLEFSIMHTDSLGIALGGTSGKGIDLPPIPLCAADGQPNLANVASYAAVTKRSVNLADAYDTKEFDFSGMRYFDQRNDYRSCSFLTIPLVNNADRVIAVLQLLNARDRRTGQVLPFAKDDQETVEALAAQAAMALDNQQLIAAQKALLESFIKVIATAIDAKSHYTGNHCGRVPVVTEMLARAACNVSEGPLAGFDLNEDGWEELRIAAWLHDCGKITTPVHVMDKATKLQTIYDRIETVRARFEILRRDIELRCSKKVAAEPTSDTATRAERDAAFEVLDQELAFLERANIGGEFLSKADQERIRAIGARTFTSAGQQRRLLSDEEVANLSVSRGTLTDQERMVINGHMVQTIAMLKALPFPRHLRRVPEYAAGHHERLDGGGYPRGTYAGDLAIPARIMAIADVFEALTAQDRPYKPGKSLSQAMAIMAAMKEDNHIDADLFDLFVSSGVYRSYGERFLPADQLDQVDEGALLARSPRPFALPPASERLARRERLLPEYEALGRTLAASLAHSDLTLRPSTGAPAREDPAPKDPAKE